MQTVVPSFIAFTIAMAVYFVGAALTKRLKWLHNFNIPAPVSGGIAVALAIWAVYVVTGHEIKFELDRRDTLLVVFFATIGLNARFSDLIRGGRPLALLLGLTAVFILLQNAVAFLGVSAFDMPTPTSVLIGSAALIGGHGTAIAWGPEIEAMVNVTGTAEIGIAAATLGLVLAASIGGPIAQYLISRHGLTPDSKDTEPMVGLPASEEAQPGIDYLSFMQALFTVNVAVILGYVANIGLASAGIKLPLFVPCLIVGILISNLQPRLFPKLKSVTGTPVLALISEFSLSVFLAMSLMSMQLWTLMKLAGPLFAVLGLQTIMTGMFCVFVVFPIMGRNYRAAVLGAGFAGFGLGATPTAIANMTAVTKRYGPAPIAFIVLPLVSAFFVDLINAFVIKLFVSL